MKICNLIVGLALSLVSGCALLGEAKSIVSEPPAACVSVVRGPDGKDVRSVNAVCASAAEALDQANALLAAVDRMTLNHVRDQVWTHEQALPYFAQTGKLGAQLDAYQALFVQGKYAEALSSANLTKTAILAVQRQVAAQARTK